MFVKHVRSVLVIILLKFFFVKSLSDFLCRSRSSQWSSVNLLFQSYLICSWEWSWKFKEKVSGKIFWDKEFCCSVKFSWNDSKYDQKFKNYIRNDLFKDALITFEVTHKLMNHLISSFTDKKNFFPIEPTLCVCDHVLYTQRWKSRWKLSRRNVIALESITGEYWDIYKCLKV